MNNFKLDNDFKNMYELIGINTNVGLGHYIAHVKYVGGWYTIDSIAWNSDNAIVDISQDFINNYLNSLNNNIQNNNSIPTMFLWKKKDIALKQGMPIILKQFNNICYTVSALQLILATNLLDDENEEKSKNNLS